VIHLQ